MESEGPRGGRGPSDWSKCVNRQKLHLRGLVITATISLSCQQIIDRALDAVCISPDLNDQSQC